MVVIKTLTIVMLGGCLGAFLDLYCHIQSDVLFFNLGVWTSALAFWVSDVE